MWVYDTSLQTFRLIINVPRTWCSGSLNLALEHDTLEVSHFLPLASRAVLIDQPVLARVSSLGTKILWSPIPVLFGAIIPLCAENLQQFIIWSRKLIMLELVRSRN